MGHDIIISVDNQYQMRKNMNFFKLLVSEKERFLMVSFCLGSTTSSNLFAAACWSPEAT